MGKSRLIRFGYGSQIFFYSAVVNTQKLVCTGGHVNEIWLAFRTFFVNKAVDSIIPGLCLHKTIHNLEQCFPKPWGTMLGCPNALCLVCTGLIGAGVNACKGGQVFASVKTGDIPNFSD